MENGHSTYQTFRIMIKKFGNKHVLFLVTLLTVFLASLELTGSYLVKELLDFAMAQNSVMILKVIGVLSGLSILGMVSIYFRTWLAGYYTENGIAKLRKMVANHLMYLPVDELEKKHSGEVISRMTNDMNRIREFASQSLISIIYQPLAALGAFIYLLTLNWQLTLLSTFVVPFILKLSSRVTTPIAAYTKKIQEQLALVNVEVQDAVTGVEIVKAFGVYSVLKRRHDKVVDQAVRAGIRLSRKKALLKGISVFFSMLPFFMTFGFGGFSVIKGRMSIGAFIAFITLLNHLTSPIGQFPNLLGELKGQMVAAARVFEMLNLERERDTGEKLRLLPNKSVVSFRNVSFRYPNGEKVLEDINFEVDHGEKIAIVGLSGSGKTTILKLILGYYDTFEGEIEIFGHRIQDWNLTNLREEISLVAQDVYLFPGTIADNISFGKATYEEIISATKVANARDFILDLKSGYQTDVGEFGDRLSGGQKQRISIARAILKDASLLLLDEATSALDTQSEYQVQKALENYLKEDIVSIIISHRLSTIKCADRILVINNGQIVEEGKHDELVKKNGFYKELYLRQMDSISGLEDKEAVM